MRITYVLLFLMVILNLSSQETDPQGRKQGYWKKKDAQGKLVYEGEFRDDVPVGKFKYYYPNDSVKAILDFRAEGKIAYAKLFHPNGKMMAKGKYLHKETKDSVWTYFDEAGVLISKDSYNKGKKDGACFVYFPDGKVSEERRYKQDILNGPFADYFPGSSIRAKGQYIDGKMEGRIVYYYPNGVEVAAGFYKNGQKNGPWLYRTESNKVREKELYKNGVLAGEKETAEFFAKHKEPQAPAAKTPEKNNVSSPKKK